MKQDLQYRVATSLNRFRTTLERHDELTADQEPWVREAHKATILGEIIKLEAKIGEYEDLATSK